MSSPFFPYGARAGPDDVHGSVAPPPFAEVASAHVEPAAAVDVLQHCADGGEADQPRSTADDERIAIHEASHATVGRLLGQSLCGVTCDAGDGFSGRCWGPEYESRFANGGDSASTLARKIRALMPQPGEARDGTADIVLHVHNRVVELCAGSVGEELFLSGSAWVADDDRKQEGALASLVASSPESAEAFIRFCRVEAAALLRSHEHIVRALTAVLLIRRTLTGSEIDEVIAHAVATKLAENEHQRRVD